MSRALVCAERLGKRFDVLRSHKSVIRLVRSIALGEPLTRASWVLRDVSFEIERGERVALLGRNGSGKTTLLRVMAGIYEKTSGMLSIVEQPRALFSYAAGFMPDLALIDNLYLFGAVHGMSRALLARHTEAILLETELQDLRDVPLKVLSTGQTQRLALSIFSRSAGGFLIFDEALSNVDQGFLEHCHAIFQAFADAGRTVVMTSHHASFLRAHCTSALWLEGGTIRMHGALTDVLRQYEASFAADARSTVPGRRAAAGAR